MATERFQVKNVKCDGCATRICQHIKRLGGVNAVEVDVSSGEVEVSGESFSRDALIYELSNLGYPLLS